MVFHWPLRRFVIIASSIGVIGSAACLIQLRKSQYDFLKRPYCKLAFDILEKNTYATDIIGTPIRFIPPDLIDKSNMFQDLEVDFSVPLEGSKKSAALRVFADRGNIDEEWSIKRLEMRIKNFNKLLIVYKRKPDE